MCLYCVFFFSQAEDGIRDWSVTGVQTCALPISGNSHLSAITIKSRRFQPTPTCGPFRFVEALRRILPRRIAGMTARLNTRRMAASSRIDRKRRLVRSEERRVGKEGRLGGRTEHE